MFDLILGCGQGGSRLAKEISKVFNVAGRYINLADIDYTSFDVPEKHKLVVDGNGTGRDAEVGEKITLKNFEVIKIFIESAIYQHDVGKLCMCVGGGGGSGTGMMLYLIEWLLDFKYIDILLLYTLPRKSEGLPARPQALFYLNKVIKNYMSGTKQVAPVIIDNEYVSKIFTDKFNIDFEYWVSINRGIANTLKTFYSLTQVDTVKHIDTASGFGALDYNELLRVLFFKDGFVDFRGFEIEYPDDTNLKALIRKSSLIFKGLDLRTCKAGIVAVAMPDNWKGHKETNEFVDAVFTAVSKFIGAAYILRSSFYSKHMNRCRVLCLFSGLTRGNGLDKIISETAKETEKFSSKDKNFYFDISEIKKLKK